MMDHMKYRFRTLTIIFLLLASAFPLCGAPNMYLVSLFTNESVSKNPTLGSRLTVGFGEEALNGSASFRVHTPDTHITLHASRIVHGEGTPFTGFLKGNLAYLSYALHNGTTSLVAAYDLKARTASKKFPTLFSIGIGLHGKSSWSDSYDGYLWNIDPHLSFSVAQGFFDLLHIKLFISTDVLGMPESNFSNWYGVAMTLAITENLMLQVRPLVRFSDFFNESMTITEHEIACSVYWSGIQNRRYWMQEAGVWL